ncbi:MAG: hypothetical protein IPH71_06030 [Proteobacteria bacterium]|nr:hypothetical protein [Pseudomonadota bacterium]
MLEFARWKYIVVAAVTVLALVIAAPNFFGEDIALQVVRKDRAVIDDAGRKSVEDAPEAQASSSRVLPRRRAHDAALQRRECPVRRA